MRASEWQVAIPSLFLLDFAMADTWTSPDASSTPRIKPEGAIKANRSTVNGKRVAKEGLQLGRSNEDDEAESGGEHSQAPKVKPEKKPAEKEPNNDDDEEEDDEDEPKSRKRLKAANGRPRRSEAPNLDEEEEEVEEVRPATKIFVRDPKDG
jgi:hypothetical protein